MEGRSHGRGPLHAPVPIARSRAGVSLLLEVILGFGIFATSLLLLFGIFPTSQRSLVMAKNQAQAICLAREAADYLRQLGNADNGYTHPKLSHASYPYTFINPPDTYPADGSHQVDMVSNGQPTTTVFNIQYRVDEKVPNKLKDVLVQVQWPEGNPGSASQFIHEVDLEFYVTQH